MSVKRLVWSLTVLLVVGVVGITSYYFILLRNKPAGSYPLSELQLKVEDVHDLPWGTMGKVVLRKLTLTNYKENEDVATMKFGFLKQGKRGSLTLISTSQYATGNDVYYINSSANPPLKVGDIVDAILLYLPQDTSVTPELIREKIPQLLGQVNNSGNSESVAKTLKSWGDLSERMSGDTINETLNSTEVMLSPRQFYLLGFLKYQ